MFFVCNLISFTSFQMYYYSSLNIIFPIKILLLTLFQIEVATGKFPYPKWNSVFDQLTQVVQGEPPHLRDQDDRFSIEFKTFVNTWYVSLIGLFWVMQICMLVYLNVIF